MAGFAGFKPANLDLGFGAEEGVFKVDAQVEAQVVATLLPRGALLTASPAHIEHLSEQIAEDVADIHVKP